MSRRVAWLDAMRGVALGGIAVGNVMWFSGVAVGASESPPSVLDDAIVFVVHVLVDGKFYGLFSLLFGVSFGLMLDKAQRVVPGDGAVAAVVTRRIGLLAAIGLAHAFVLWFGDIISLYALASVPLWWVRRWAPRRLFALAIACLVTPIAISVALTLAHRLGWPLPSTAHGPSDGLVVFGQGTYLAVLETNAAFVRQRWVLALMSGRLFRLLGLFALGLAARRVWASRSPRWWDRRGIVQLVVLAIGSNVTLAWMGHWGLAPRSLGMLVHDVAYAIAVPSGALVYAALIARWAKRGGRLVDACAAAGRLSLSHYLGQSVVMAVIFYGYGAGAWGGVGATQAVAVAAIVVAAQIAVSRPYLRRFGRGPLEALMRHVVWRGATRSPTGRADI